MSKIRIALASKSDRENIYRMRHAVYAAELSQHACNERESLHDRLDGFNEYIVATDGTGVIGFVSITPPEGESYSVEKYFASEDLPFALDSTVFEVRLLTVPSCHRGRSIAGLLMFAAFRWIEARGGTRVVAIGRQELRDLYRKAGFERLGPQAQSGAVTYELMSATMPRLRATAARYMSRLARAEERLEWAIDAPFLEQEQCLHGGAFFESIGETFETLDRRSHVINADVLDAWFPPAPSVVHAVEQHLPWLLSTSPPQESRGLIQIIAETRQLAPESIVVGAGSSSLIYLAFRTWLTKQSRVLLPDPTYGEYAHILERVIGCHTERLALTSKNGFRIDPEQFLARAVETQCDLAVLVNPNNPTGRLMPRSELAPMLVKWPARARLWIDEAYIDYAGTEHSVEQLAAETSNVFVCKSLSKAYALSGARAAYLCGHPSTIRSLRRVTPPWAVGLPAQVAAVAALRDPSYYAERYRETHTLRAQLASSMRAISPTIEVLESCANFIICHMDPSGPDATTICERCAAQDVFIRDAGTISAIFGDHALRIAVKDAKTNARIVTTIAEAIARP